MTAPTEESQCEFWAQKGLLFNSLESLTTNRQFKRRTQRVQSRTWHGARTLGRNREKSQLSHYWRSAYFSGEKIKCHLDIPLCISWCTVGYVAFFSIWCAKTLLALLAAVVVTLMWITLEFSGLQTKRGLFQIQKWKKSTPAFWGSWPCYLFHIESDS